ncbi:MAG: dipeptide ABC transporter ATP-binding protein [Leptothrix sp. (in: b-proteobacteria)]
MSAGVNARGSMLRTDALQVVLDSDAGLVRAVDGLRLAIARGETFALVGESGCGKSMTALALMRLLPENGRFEAGSIRLDGTELLDLPEAQMRAVRGGRLGMIFQEPATSLNPVMRVGAQLIEAIETHTPLRGATARVKAIDWLRRVGIAEPERRIDDYPFRLSGGQKQRVMIAIALAAEPDFLIADEPTTALDVTIQKQILDLLKDLQREHGMGLLLITHDLGVVAGMAQQVALMYAGQIVEVATAADFFAAPQHPYARLLLQALPDSAKRGEPLAAIAGAVPPLHQRFTACRFAPRCALAEPRCRQGEPALVELAGFGRPRSVRCVLAAAGEIGSTVRSAEPVAPQAAVAVTLRSGPAAATVPLGAPLLSVEALTVRFPQRSGFFQRVSGANTAVEGVSFTIAAGRTLALVGESGCGKTTTGKAITQLLRQVAQIEGRAVLDGQDLFALQGQALREARRQIQLIFQDPFASLNPRLRVAEILEEGLVALRPELDADQRRARITTLIEQVGLRLDALQRWPHEFSGGQRQRIAIARALAVQPRLIVCDEPTSALDVSVQAQILNLLGELQRDTGVALLFITHNIGVVEYVAHEVAVMHRGRIIEIGAADQVLGAPQQAYTRDLLAAVPRL